MTSLPSSCFTLSCYIHAAGQVTPLTWPAVVARAFAHGTLGAFLRPLVSDEALDVIRSLGGGGGAPTSTSDGHGHGRFTAPTSTPIEYASLSASRRLAILKALVDGVSASERVGAYLSATAEARGHALAYRRRLDAEDEAAGA